MSTMVQLDNGLGYEVADRSDLTRADLEAAALVSARRPSGVCEWITVDGEPMTSLDAASMAWWAASEGHAVLTRRLSTAERRAQFAFIAEWSV